MDTPQLPQAFAADLAAVASIEAVSKILDVVCRSTGMGFSAVARVTADRWIACAVRDEISFGLPVGGELQVETTICNEIRGSGELVVIDHVAKDQAFCRHPTPALYGFQSYISVPIVRRDGRFFGTLCAIDPRPARLKTPETIAMFTLFADLIAFHLDAQERLTASEQALLTERQTAELRDQFIAVLGHDLRNPLAATQAAAGLLSTMPLGDRAMRFARVIQNSAIRMAGLIDNVMDFARGRLGGGLELNCVCDTALPLVLEEVIAELQTAWGSREIRTDFALDRPISYDRARISQLFSNLLANALTHGDPAAPVSVAASVSTAGLELSVANQGAPIPPEMFERLFQPFSRASARAGQQGLGLGLYIASEIARAHSGTLQVTSSPEETRFTFRMPIAEPTGVSAG